MVHKIDEDISPELGVLISATLGNAVRWFTTMGDVRLGQSVVIIGPGQQGLAGVVVAKESGADPIIVVGRSRDRKRLEMARSFGADIVINSEEEDAVGAVSQVTGGEMADLVMDATGHPSGASMALALAGTRATLVLPGLYGGDTQVPLLLDKVILKEMKLVGVFSHDFPAVEAAIKLVGRKKYPLEEMISHHFPLDQAEEAVKLVGGEMEGELPLKVVLNPSVLW